MSLASQVSALATRVASEFKAVRNEMSQLSSGANPWTYYVTTADTLNSTTTAVNVTGLTIPATLAAGKYAFECRFLFTSAATTTGIQPAITFPAQVTMGARSFVPLAATTMSISQGQNVSGTANAATATPGVAPLMYLGSFDGIFIVSGTMTSAIQITIKSEVNASEVAVKAGSFLRYRRL